MRDFRVFTADSEHNKFIIPILACHLTDSLPLPFSIPISAINIITLTFILQLHAHKHFVSLFKPRFSSFHLHVFHSASYWVRLLELYLDADR